VIRDLKYNNTLITICPFSKECARGPGKTRGAIGFALIFLCFVSLYQDKEMKRKIIALKVPFVLIDTRIFD
jgi:hypothetical protein